VTNAADSGTVTITFPATGESLPSLAGSVSIDGAAQVGATLTAIST
jgi:hypothetical protein